MNYSIFDPTGNITAIITSDTDASERTSEADKVMALEPSVEQVGFFLPGHDGFDAGLFMAGGEFCGNASMSAAALYAINKGAVPGEKSSVVLRVSGTPDPVIVELECTGTNAFKGRVSMPEALDITEAEIPDEPDMKVPVVLMPGIVHAIVPESFGIGKAEKVLPIMCAKLNADAMGMMLIDEAMTRITPVVYVPSAGTLVRENSCASGTAAVGAYIAADSAQHTRKSFSEPGGTLTAEAFPHGSIFIEGNVVLVK